MYIYIVLRIKYRRYNWSRLLRDKKYLSAKNKTKTLRGETKNLGVDSFELQILATRAVKNTLYDKRYYTNILQETSR